MTFNEMNKSREFFFSVSLSLAMSQLELPLAKQLQAKSKLFQVNVTQAHRWRREIPPFEWTAIFQRVLDTYDSPDLTDSLECRVDAYETVCGESICESEVEIKMDRCTYLIHSIFPKRVVVSTYAFQNGTLTKLK